MSYVTLLVVTLCNSLDFRGIVVAFKNSDTQIINR